MMNYCTQCHFIYSVCTKFRFNNLLPFQTPQELDGLLEEFIDFQESDIPSTVLEQAVVVTDTVTRVTHHRLDIIWHHLSIMKDPDHTLRFNRLSQIAKLIMVIPHSNAQEERVFSMVRKNKTAFRPSLDPKGTLSSILTMKLSVLEPAHRYEPSKDVLTWGYNNSVDYNNFNWF